MSHVCTTDTTISAGSWGTLCYPPGASVSITVPLAAYTTYDFTDKYALLTIRREGGPDLFTRSSDNSELTFSGEGTANQKLVAAILPTTQSAANSSITFAAIALEDHTLEASIEFRANSSTTVTDFQVQGNLHFTNKRGKIVQS